LLKFNFLYFIAEMDFEKYNNYEPKKVYGILEWNLSEGQLHYPYYGH